MDWPTVPWSLKPPEVAVPPPPATTEVLTRWFALDMDAARPGAARKTSPARHEKTRTVCFWVIRETTG
ncbi:MAG: hypothetical protein Kow0092_31960 [Deferrisomatales bacterium]